MSEIKVRAISQNLKITFFRDYAEKFEVGIIGNRSIPYELNFEPENVKCSCPDYQFKKRICKHLYFIIHLSESLTMFVYTNDLSQLQTLENINILRLNLKNMIEQKKLVNTNSQEIQIERDDCCPICTMDFLTQIEKCSRCSHVFHQECLSLWWRNASVPKGKCPYCRDDAGLRHMFEDETNPWANFRFNELSEVLQEL